MTRPRRGWRVDDWMRPHQEGRYPTGQMRPARPTPDRWWNRPPTTPRGVLLEALALALTLTPVLLAVRAERSFIVMYVVVFVAVRTALSLRRLRKQNATR